MLARIQFGFLLLFTCCCLASCSGRKSDSLRSYDYSGDYLNFCQRLIDNPKSYSEEETFQSLLHAYYENSLALSPESATREGRKEYNHLWSDRSEAGLQHQQQVLQKTRDVLHHINPELLPTASKLNRDLLLWQVEFDIRGFEFQSEYLMISGMGGPHTWSINVLKNMPTDDLNDYNNIIARLQGFPGILEQVTTRLKKGMQLGIVPPKVTVIGVPDQINGMITPKPFESPMLQGLKEFPSWMSVENQRALQREANELFLRNINPALKAFKKFIEIEYLPACRNSIAWSDLPNGERWYANQVRFHTTTELTPDEIHNIGLQEVQRIKAEMQTVINKIGFQGNLQAFFEHLRTDPRFFCRSADELLQRYRDIAKRADPELVKLFGTLPRMPYGVVAVPNYLEKNTTTAYYMSGSKHNSQPGYFYANTYNLQSRPTWEMVPLTLHEAVPGHHLQISIAQELEDLPPFRRNIWFTSFGEGWALYAESLGEEMGMYNDPYDKFGQLTYEMWRAIRLVVDTGIHAKGWSRDMAIEFFKQNAGKSQHDIEVEVDRYIGWAGQALAYKIGELKIKELRAYASKRLGKDFRLRNFHDKVLENGTIPLSVLDANIKAWVESERSPSTK